MSVPNGGVTRFMGWADGAAGLGRALAIGTIAPAVALAGLAFASPAGAAKATAGSAGSAPVVQQGAGFATASKTGSGGYSEANAYEFAGGVGVSAFVGSTGSSVTFSGSAQAAMSETFRVGQSTNLAHQLTLADDTVFELLFTIKAGGETNVTTGPIDFYRPGYTTLANASYSYDWSIGGLGGHGSHGTYKYPDKPQQETDSHDLLGGILYVHMGDALTLNLSASAYAMAYGFFGQPAAANADFGHTLRWGGISGIAARDGQGNPIDLPTGFELSLLGDSSGMNYYRAAAPNPYTAAADVPEPASWAMMVIGFGVIGSAVRSRRNRDLRATA